MSDTRTRLMDAAEDLVRRRGPDGFSYSDLATAVGIRKPSIHYHFPYKNDLLAALILRYRERLQAALRTIDATETDAAGSLVAYVGIYRAALKDGRSMCLCVSLGIANETLETACMDELRLFHDVSIAWLDALHRRGAADGSLVNDEPAQAWAHRVLATLEGAQVSARIAGGLPTFDLIASALRT